MLAPRLDLRHSTSLAMTPQLRQAIALLQYSNLEIAAHIAQEAESNPLLSVSPPDSHGTHTPEPPPPASTHDAFTTGHTPDASLHAQPDHDDQPFSWRETGLGGGDYPPETDRETPATAPTLHERLSEQARLTFTTPQDNAIAAVLLASLDEVGRLTTTPEAIAQTLSTPLETIERIRTLMMQFDPSGLFATSLAECLAAQLREKNRYDPAIEVLLQNLDLLATRNLRRLQTLCEVDAEDLADMIAELRALNPKPGFDPDATRNHTLIPDVLVTTRGPSFHVELNPDTLPRVTLDTTLRDRMSKDPTARPYLTDRAASASWLIKSLEQRARSILAISRAIITRQENFLHDGIAALKPMTLRDIADDTTLHESTVSRVTTNKYIATPRGTFELKFFFSTALGSNDTAQSAEAIRHRIRQMIEKESPNAILSDDAITERLQKDGIEIMRRTVAKYREALNLPNSAQRRRTKKLL